LYGGIPINEVHYICEKIEFYEHLSLFPKMQACVVTA